MARYARLPRPPLSLTRTLYFSATAPLPCGVFLASPPGLAGMPPPSFQRRGSSFSDFSMLQAHSDHSPFYAHDGPPVSGRGTRPAWFMLLKDLIAHFRFVLSFLEMRSAALAPSLYAPPSSSISPGLLIPARGQGVDMAGLLVDLAFAMLAAVGGPARN